MSHLLVKRCCCAVVAPICAGLVTPAGVDLIFPEVPMVIASSMPSVGSHGAAAVITIDDVDFSAVGGPSSATWTAPAQELPKGSSAGKWDAGEWIEQDIGGNTYYSRIVNVEYVGTAGSPSFVSGWQVQVQLASGPGTGTMIWSGIAKVAGAGRETTAPHELRHQTSPYPAIGTAHIKTAQACWPVGVGAWQDHLRVFTCDAGHYWDASAGSWVAILGPDATFEVTVDFHKGSPTGPASIFNGTHVLTWAGNATSYPHLRFEKIIEVPGVSRVIIALIWDNPEGGYSFVGSTEYWDEYAYYDWETDTYIPGWVGGMESFRNAPYGRLVASNICPGEEYAEVSSSWHAWQHYTDDAGNFGYGHVTVGDYTAGTLQPSIYDCPEEITITINGGAHDTESFTLTRRRDGGASPPAANRLDYWSDGDAVDAGATARLYPFFIASSSGWYTDWLLAGFRLVIAADNYQMILPVSGHCPRLGDVTVLLPVVGGWGLQDTVTANVEASI